MSKSKKAKRERSPQTMTAIQAIAGSIGKDGTVYTKDALRELSKQDDRLRFNEDLGILYADLRVSDFPELEKELARRT